MTKLLLLRSPRVIKDSQRNTQPADDTQSLDEEGEEGGAREEGGSGGGRGGEEENVSSG